VEKSGGGMAGVRDEGGIRATLEFVQDDLYYPEIADKAAYLMYSLCRGHFFADCNKRISITLTLYFLVKNGYMYLAKNFMEEMEAIGYHVAAGHIDRDLLTEVMLCIVNDEDYSESIKLELIEAMSKDIGFSEQ
jgi:death-on-curing protein